MERMSLHGNAIAMKIAAPCRTRAGTRRWLNRKANWIRLSAMTMNHHAGLGHTGGDLSVGRHSRRAFSGRRACSVDPAQPRWPAARPLHPFERPRCRGVLFHARRARILSGIDQLKTYMDPLSMLNGHPDRNKLPGVEANTGPLGHGLPIAVGAALAARMRKESWRVFVLTGDGELQEGSNWEAAMTAQHYGLDNFTVIVDRNRIQQGDFTENTIRMEPLAARFAAFGFAVEEIDGHSTAALLRAASRICRWRRANPRASSRSTIKGKGVSFAENQPAWHHGVPTKEQLATAAAELGVEVAW